MKKLLIITTILAAFASCSKMDAALDMPNKMDGMSGKMDTMSSNMKELERLTKVAESTKEILDTKNYTKLAPIPTDIIPWAKIAAENMLVTDELVPFFYIKMKDITSLRYDDNAFGDNATTKPQTAKEFEVNKIGLFSALAAVAGFLPEEKVTEILRKLSSSDEYSKTSLQILTLRSYFIQNVLMTEKYKESELVDLGAIEEAIKYNSALERIATLPYADQLNIGINIFEVMPEYNEGLSIQADTQAYKNNWNTIYSGITNYAKVGQYTSDQKITASQQARLNSAIRTVEAKIKSQTQP